MGKRLHTNTKIFFPNPYMVRVEFPIVPAEEANAEYRKILRYAYKSLKGTWGYSTLEFETWQTEPQDPEPDPAPTPVTVLANIISAPYNPGHMSVLRGYICFEEEIDALQFRLSLSAKSRQVTMWPKREFTIHEVVETDDS